MSSGRANPDHADYKTNQIYKDEQDGSLRLIDTKHLFPYSPRRRASRSMVEAFTPTARVATRCRAEKPSATG